EDLPTRERRAEQWPGEIDRQQHPQYRQQEERSEREREMTLGHVERTSAQQRPPDVLDEQPEADEHHRSEQREPTEISREQRRDEPDESGGEQPQLREREPARVEFDARPDRDELRHRAHDGETDP